MSAGLLWCAYKRDTAFSGRRGGRCTARTLENEKRAKEAARLLTLSYTPDEKIKFVL